MDTNTLPADMADLWARFKVAEKITERQDAMKEIIKKLPLDFSKKGAVDMALVECAVRPSLFELGMSIVMEASGYVREAFRRRLIECGDLLLVMRLAKLMDRPLSRDEIVMLGNRHVGALVYEEIAGLLSSAEKTEGITPLDLCRLRKQFASDLRYSYTE